MRAVRLSLPLLLLAAAAAPWPDAAAGRGDEIEFRSSADDVTLGDEPVGPTPEEREAAFADYEAELARGQKARAADALTTLVGDPDLDDFHAEGFARLALLLADLDLPYGALVAYTKALELDSQAPWSGPAINEAFKLADRVGDPAILEPVFARNVGGDVDRTTRSRMAWLAARENYRQGSYSLTLGLLKLVVEESPIYPDAKMLEGVVLNQQGRPTDALKPLLAALQAAEGVERDERFLNALTMNVARSYYAANNFPRAIEYFAKVSRSSDFWLEAQFERAWAHFRLEDMNGAIALLHNHGSPYFEGYYYPEGELLRVYALFLLCKFPEASKEIDSFKERYQPLHRQLQGATAGMTAEQAFQLARAWVQRGEPGEVPPSVLLPLRKEARLAGAIDAVSHAESELGRLANISANPFVAEVGSWVRARRDGVVQAEGERVLGKLDARSEQLAGMLTNVEISKLDMLQFETRLYEQASVTGQLADRERTVMRQQRVRRGYVYWPWQGEYWADELGYYRVNAIPECPAGLRSSQE